MRDSAQVRSFVFFAGFTVALLLIGCGGIEKRPSSPNLKRPFAVTFFVATNGNDQWSGTRPSADRRNQDGPFATVGRAVEAVRQSRAKGEISPGERCRILLR